MVGGFLQINQFSPSTCNKPKPQGRFLKITLYFICTAQVAYFINLRNLKLAIYKLTYYFITGGGDRLLILFYHAFESIIFFPTNTTKL
ncbi:hypothetical protein WN943_009323 [Citrus x changshan-huyou]